MPTKGFITIEDYSQETSTMTFNLPEITALNFAGVTQDLDEVRDAVAAVVLGKIVNVGFTRTYNDDAINLTPVSDKNAQRERKFLVTMIDVKGWLDALGTIRNPGYGKTFNVEIPCIDVDLVANNKDEVDITAGDGLTLANALAANIKSSTNRDAATSVADPDYCRVVSIRKVGRNT